MKTSTKTIAVVQRLARPAGAVWELIRGGRDIHRMMPAVIETCRVERSGVGARRYCTTKQGPIAETILCADDDARLFRYRIDEQSMFGRLFVVPAIADFLKRYPRVSVELVVNDRYVNLVEEGFDLAIRVGLPADTSARGRKIAESSRILVGSPAYLKTYGRPRNPDELRKHECLVHGDASAPMIWRFGKGTEKRALVRARGRFAANSSEAVAMMAREGLGLALVADWLVAEDVRRGRLVLLLPEYAAPPARVYALSPPGRYPNTTVRALSDHLAECIGARLRTRSPVER